MNRIIVRCLTLWLVFLASVHIALAMTISTRPLVNWIAAVMFLAAAFLYYGHRRNVR